MAPLQLWSDGHKNNDWRAGEILISRDAIIYSLRSKGGDHSTCWGAKKLRSWQKRLAFLKCRDKNKCCLLLDAKAGSLLVKQNADFCIMFLSPTNKKQTSCSPLKVNWCSGITVEWQFIEESITAWITNLLASQLNQNIKMKWMFLD